MIEMLLNYLRIVPQCTSDLEKVVRGAETGSRTDFTPLEGRMLRGWPVMAIKGGEVVVEEGKLTCDSGIGRCLNQIPISLHF